MILKKRILLAIIIIFSNIIVSSQTKLFEYDKLVIVSSGGTFEDRLLIERDLAEALSEYNVKNELSINIIPQNIKIDQLDKDSIKAVIKNRGIDGALVIRIEENFKKKTKVKAGSTTPHSNNYDISYDDFILATSTFNSGKKVAKEYIGYVTLKTHDDVLIFEIKLKHQKSPDVMAENITKAIIKQLKKNNRI